MVTTREKIAILKSLQDSSIDPSKLQEYLSYASIPGLTVPILEKFLEYLIDLDAQISASYELLPDEEWTEIVSRDEIVLDKTFEIRTKIDCFILHFKAFYDVLSNTKITEIMHILCPLFKIKTRNIQFLVFLVAKEDPKAIFSHLLIQLKKDPLLYCPFFASLLVRLNFDICIKKKCLRIFFKNIFDLRPSENIQFLLQFQSLLYILCFKEFSFSGDISSIKDDNSENNNIEILPLIRKVEKMQLFQYLNKDVVSRFCQMYGMKEPPYSASKEGPFCFFPFDYPILPGIGVLIQEFYVHFS